MLAAVGDCALRFGRAGTLPETGREEAPVTESEVAKHQDRGCTNDLDEAVERARSGEDRVVVTRGDERVVAVISVSELQLLAELEAERDLRALRQAEASANDTRISWQAVKADAGSCPGKNTRLRVAPPFRSGLMSVAE